MRKNQLQDRDGEGQSLPKEIKIRRQICEEQAKDEELENKKVDMNEPELLKKWD